MAYNLSEDIVIESPREPSETPGVIDPGSSNIDVAILGRMADIVGEDGDELEGILDWIRRRGADSPERILWEFRNLMNTLSSPRLGESRIKRIYRYVTLDRSVRDAQKEMEQMEAPL